MAIKETNKKNYSNLVDDVLKTPANKLRTPFSSRKTDTKKEALESFGLEEGDLSRIPENDQIGIGKYCQIIGKRDAFVRYHLRKKTGVIGSVTVDDLPPHRLVFSKKDAEALKKRIDAVNDGKPDPVLRMDQRSDRGVVKERFHFFLPLTEEQFKVGKAHYLKSGRSLEQLITELVLRACDAENYSATKTKSNLRSLSGKK